MYANQYVPIQTDGLVRKYDPGVDIETLGSRSHR